MDKKKINLMTQGYVAPRAESLVLVQESLLCSSPILGDTDGESTEGFGLDDGLWDQPLP